jgi:hypothetical protein
MGLTRREFLELMGKGAVAVGLSSKDGREYYCIVK